MKDRNLYRLQKETRIFFRIYAFALLVRAIIYSVFSEVVYSDIFKHEHLRLSDKFSGLVVGVFIIAFAMLVFATSFAKGKELRRYTLVLIGVELLTFIIPILVKLQGLDYPDILTFLHFVQLLVLVYLFKNQTVKKNL